MKFNSLRTYFLFSLLFIFLLEYNFAHSQTISDEKKGFNIIKDNELTPSKYTFDDFMDDYVEGMTFVCIDPDNSWHAQYQWQYTITEMTADFGKSCRLEKFSRTNELGEKETDPDQFIDLNENNFPEFWSIFIKGNCLQFESGFPVKFLKVKTVYKPGDIEFYRLPQDMKENVIENAQIDNVIYYAYKSTTLGNKKYVYLGTKKFFATERETDIYNTLVGWVVYEEDGHSQNVVLWNTDIGLRPKSLEDVELDRKPLVFFSDKAFTAQQYYDNGQEPNRDDLLVNTTGLSNFFERFESNKKQSFRWLPMYNERMGNPATVNIGVIDSLSEDIREITNIGRMDYLQVAILIDASKSMKLIWDNLDKVLINILSDVLNQNFVNIAGDEIKLKIKIYYFTDKLYILNTEEFITSTEDVHLYKDKIESISDNLEYTEYLLPSIYKFYNQIYADLGNESFVTIVIGDAGDYQYKVTFDSIPELVEKSKKQLIPIFGVAFNSEFYYNSSYWKTKTDIQINENITQQIYMNSYDRFLNNFMVISQIDKPEIDEKDINNISNTISITIVNEIEHVIHKLMKDIPGIEFATKEIIIKPSAFSQNYLDNLLEKIPKLDQGTYFEEGIVLDKDHSDHALFDKDVLIEKEKIDKLERTITEFTNTTDDANFGRLLRFMLAIFFEIDYSEVDQKKMKETTLADFWEAVVGDRQIAQKIIPDLFQHENITFEQIEKNWIHFKNEIINNASSVKNNINYQLDNDIGLYRTLKSYEKDGNRVFMDYYWFDVSKIRLFKNVDFNGLQ